MKPPNTPTQKARLKPREIYKALVKRKFSMFRRSDVILINSHKGLFPKLIRFSGGDNSTVTHAEIYGHNGNSIGACGDGTKTRNIHRFFKGNHDVYVYRCNTLSISSASDIFYKASRWLGRPYDWWGIGCQFLDWITRSTWFSRKLNGAHYPYCSELIQRAYGHIRVSKKVIGAATPDNLFTYINGSKTWKTVFSMVKDDGKWDYNMKEVKHG